MNRRLFNILFWTEVAIFGCVVALFGVAALLVLPFGHVNVSVVVVSIVFVLMFGDLVLFWTFRKSKIIIVPKYVYTVFKSVGIMIFALIAFAGFVSWYWAPSSLRLGDSNMPYIPSDTVGIVYLHGQFSMQDRRVLPEQVEYVLIEDVDEINTIVLMMQDFVYAKQDYRNGFEYTTQQRMLYLLTSQDNIQEINDSFWKDNEDDEYLSVNNGRNRIDLYWLYPNWNNSARYYLSNGQDCIDWLIDNYGNI
ncbi:MAG: hypothetical protein LBK70_02300 [Clostridiales bacterium]|nr:hypothetical protein [Clostridiales bacterium]